MSALVPAASVLWLRTLAAAAVMIPCAGLYRRQEV